MCDLDIKVAHFYGRYDMKILTIIGNGFDLGHGLPTRFSDFISSNKDIFEEKYKVFKSGNDNWNEIEKRYGDLLCDIMSERSWVDTTEIVEKIINGYGLNEYGEVDYYNYNSDSFDEEYEHIRSFISLLTEFEADFLLYLKKACSDQEICNCRQRKEIKRILDSSTEIISFNYTRTIEILYGVQNVSHIHGTVNDNIAIGSGALDNAKESVVDIEYPTMDKFEKSKYGLQEMMQYYEEDMDGHLVEKHFIKRFFDEVVAASEKQEEELFDLLDEKSKDSLISRKNTIADLKNKQYDIVYIIGHSLEDADFSVLDAIDKHAEVICFYYDDEDERKKKIHMEQLAWKYKLIPDKVLFAS